MEGGAILATMQTCGHPHHGHTQSSWMWVQPVCRRLVRAMQFSRTPASVTLTYPAPAEAQALHTHEENNKDEWFNLQLIFQNRQAHEIELTWAEDVNMFRNTWSIVLRNKTTDFVQANHTVGDTIYVELSRSSAHFICFDRFSTSVSTNSNYCSQFSYSCIGLQ